MNLSHRLDLSVCIITLNEESGLERCLSSLPKSCEIIILDSGSVDRTEEIAKKFDANFSFRAFDDYARQKNAAVALAGRKWVLVLDADEYLSLDLATALQSKLNQLPPAVYKVMRRLTFLGKRLSFGKTKDQPFRLFPKGHAAFVGPIHEVLEPTEDLEKSGFGPGCIHHESYRDLHDYFDKFNRYTSAIAERKLQEPGTQPPSVALMALRPFWEFFSRYVLRLGFLDGYPGYCYALISSVYGFTKYAKFRELVLKSEHSK